MMRAQKFNFAPKVSQNGGFSPKFCILDKNFPTTTFFSTAQNLGEWELPLTHFLALMTQLLIITDPFSVAAAAAAAAKSVCVQVSPSILDLGVIVLGGAIVQSLSRRSAVRHGHAVD